MGPAPKRRTARLPFRTSTVGSKVCSKEMQDDSNLYGGNAAAAQGCGVSRPIAQMLMPKT